jgi:thiol-disulfide isomerase/thioredoxin
MNEPKESSIWVILGLLLVMGLFLSVVLKQCNDNVVKPEPVIVQPVQPIVAPKPEVKPVKPPCPCPGPCKPVKPPVIKDPPQVQCKVLAFTAKWCVPCQKAKPAILDAQKRGLCVQMVDIDSEHQLAEKYAITSVPTLVIEKNGKITKTHDINELLALVE